MINTHVQANNQPERVQMEFAGGVTVVRLAGNIHTETEEYEDGTAQDFYVYDEAVFNLPNDRAETAESIAENFDAWWAYASQPDQPEMTLEERVAMLEDMVLELMIGGEDDGL